ncbi:MAG: hypothetical protein A2666_04190 [Parcubacteria group bacterium RIFCSPHIGHO2_01_FULL_47_10b]|nr:MAG: hypothetical protein A2666_04190 [Parcubacteria group bacterium RIFCSPHIGHO2_01_FULL_47_10b]
MQLILTSLATNHQIRLDIVADQHSTANNAENRVVASETVDRSEAIYETLDKLLKDATLNKTDIEQVTLAADTGASETSQRITRAVQMAFNFVQGGV